MTDIHTDHLTNTEYAALAARGYDPNLEYMVLLQKIQMDRKVCE